MKKLQKIILAIIMAGTLFMSSCAMWSDPDFQEGFRQGWNSTAPEEYRY